jgi:hypothetical protein
MVSGSGIDRFDRHSISQRFEATDQAALGRLPIALIVVATTELTIDGLVAQEVVDIDQDGVSNSDNRSLRAPASR